MTTALKPRSRAWKRIGDYPGDGILDGHIYARGPLRVISTLTLAKLPRREDTGQQWHVSASRAGHRPGDKDLQLVRAAFGLQTAEEDNHHPGVARHLWLPVDPAHRVGCECADDERVVVEPDGFRWTTPHDGPCRGCEFKAMTGKSCPLHGGTP